jgi:hypothetical protein
MTTHQLTGSEWHDGARVRAVWKSYPVRQETRYSTTYATSARRSRSSSHRLQARWVSGHQALSCCTATGRGGSNRRSSRSRRAGADVLWVYRAGGAGAPDSLDVWPP